ncbi:hypothetical protein TELCIR_19917, partial [Teladorsagia circumcincta]
TYTVMKECISEQDHYQLFPNKGYAMEEECDLVEVHGQEKNPELFAEPEPPTPTIPKGPAPLAPPIPMQAPSGFELFAEPEPPTPTIPKGPAPLAPPVPVQAPNGFGAPPIPPPPIIPVNDPRVSSSPEVTSSAADILASLRCSQCGQSDLKSEDADCERQVVVNCHDPDSVCFTRQIILNAGQTAVEKMCASWQAVKQEFPTSALDSCAEASDGRRAKDFPTDPLPPFVRTHPSGPLPHLAAPELPVVKAAPVPPTPTARQPELPPQ